MFELKPYEAVDLDNEYIYTKMWCDGTGNLGPCMCYDGPPAKGHWRSGRRIPLRDYLEYITRLPEGHSTRNYRDAPSGDGPLAAEWKDKPHRLVYDLCDWVEAVQRANTRHLRWVEDAEAEIVALKAEIKTLKGETK